MAEESPLPTNNNNNNNNEQATLSAPFSEAETCGGGNRDFVQLSNKLLMLDGSCEFERNEGIVERFQLNQEQKLQTFQELGLSSENCSLKQSVEFDLENENEEIGEVIFELNGGGIRTNLSKIQGLGLSYENCSQKRSVEYDLEGINEENGEVVELNGGVGRNGSEEISETVLNLECNIEPVDELESEKMLNCDELNGRKGRNGSEICETVLNLDGNCELDDELESEKMSNGDELNRRNEENGSVIGEGLELNGSEISETVLNLDCTCEEKDCELDELESEKKVELDEVESEKRSNGDELNRGTDRKGDWNSNGVAAGASKVGVGKFVYSREEMEALRCVNRKAQKKFWQAVRNGLEKNVKKEYEELGNLKHHKNVNRRQNAEIRSYNGREILRESSLEDVSLDKEVVRSVDFRCDDNNNGKDSNGLVGEWIEEEESDDEYESIQRPAFAVEGEPDFESGPPEDGLEYLRRVRWEAKHIPKVKVAKIDDSKLKKEQSVYMPKIPDIEKCPPHLIPSKQWEDEFVADFAELRLALSHLEDTSDAIPTDPQTIIFGPKDPKSQPSKSRASLELPTGGPTLSTVLALEPATRAAMLKKRITLFENTSELSKDDCAWLFALSAAVDSPLEADTCASLRCLLRRCAKLRARKSELDDEVVMLNVLATISGKFFRQLEN